MVQEQLLRTSVWFAAFCAGVIVVGCGDNGGEISPTQTHLSWLGSMYGQYISQNGGAAPKSIDEFRAYVGKKTTAEELSRLGASTVDELFVSPRDGKQFALVTLTNRPPPGIGTPPVVLYETEGQDGTHAVAFLGGMTDVVDQAKLTELLPASAGAR